jgi:hypothetical protein
MSEAKWRYLERRKSYAKRAVFVQWNTKPGITPARITGTLALYWGDERVMELADVPEFPATRQGYADMHSFVRAAVNKRYDIIWR